MWQEANIWQTFKVTWNYGQKNTKSEPTSSNSGWNTWSVSCRKPGRKLDDKQRPSSSWPLEFQFQRPPGLQYQPRKVHRRNGRHGEARSGQPRQAWPTPYSSSERGLRAAPAPTPNDPRCHPGPQEETARPRYRQHLKGTPCSVGEECHHSLRADHYHPHLRLHHHRRPGPRKGH